MTSCRLVVSVWLTSVLVKVVLAVSLLLIWFNVGFTEVVPTVGGERAIKTLKLAF